MLTHPTLSILHLRMNDHLQPGGYGSKPCAIHRLLSQILSAAASSTLTLRHLWISHLEKNARFCYPQIKRIFFLASKGLEWFKIGCDAP